MFETRSAVALPRVRLRDAVVARATHRVAPTDFDGEGIKTPRDARYFAWAVALTRVRLRFADVARPTHRVAPTDFDGERS